MEQKANQSNKRRKIVLGLAGGIAGATQVKEAWFKPVINAVVLPAHAQTTVDPDAGAGAGQQETEVVLQSIIDCAVTDNMDGTFTASGTLTSTDAGDDLSGYQVNVSVASLIPFPDAPPQTQPYNPTKSGEISAVDVTATTMADGSFSTMVPILTYAESNILGSNSVTLTQIGFTFDVEGTTIECSMESVTEETPPIPQTQP